MTQDLDLGYREPGARSSGEWRLVAALVLAQGLLRLQVLSDLGAGLGEAVDLGLVWGLLGDATAGLLVAAFALALRDLVKLPTRISLPLTSILVWLASLANVLYFRFFEGPLHWWIARTHWRDLPEVASAGASLATAGWIVASAAVLVVGLVWFEFRWPPGGGDRAAGSRLTWLGPVAAAGLLLVVGAQREEGSGTSIVTDHVGHLWLRGAFREVFLDYRALLPLTDYQVVARQATGRLELTPAESLARFRDWVDPEKESPSGSASGSPGRLYLEGADPEWPLAVSLREDPEARRELRVGLGLPPAGDLDVILLYLESVRYLELGTPDLAPEVFPRIDEALRRRGVRFVQAYSSSLGPGRSVRGQLSTQCSMLPNALGIATYVGYYQTRLVCLQDLFAERGYRTAWVNSIPRGFHNENLFERLHGTELFFDDVEFRRRGIEERIGSMGLADGPVLAATLEILADLAASDAPLFVSIHTIAPHYPLSVVPGFELEALAAERGYEGEYLEYLSRLRYLDEAVGDFIDGLFRLPRADRTLLVLVGDHGVGIEPPDWSDTLPRRELWARVPLAFLTAGLDGGSELRHPVHQIDVAPTIARIAGLTGEVSWIGRDMFSGLGSPWVHLEGEVLHYRTPSRACYETRSGRRCVRTASGDDPMFDDALAPIEELAEQEELFSQVALAAGLAIEGDLLLPE